MQTFTDGYLKALEDMQEKIENANSNFFSDKGYAPWSWNYEFTDQLIALKDELLRDE